MPQIRETVAVAASGDGFTAEEVDRREMAAITDLASTTRYHCGRLPTENPVRALMYDTFWAAMEGLRAHPSFRDLERVK
jgi:hypothetical protein